MIRPRVTRPKYGRTDLSYVDPSFFICGSVECCEYTYVYFWKEKGNTYSSCVPLGRKL